MIVLSLQFRILLRVHAGTFYSKFVVYKLLTGENETYQESVDSNNFYWISHANTRYTVVWVVNS